VSVCSPLFAIQVAANEPSWSAVTPSTAKVLIDDGYKIKVERSEQSVFDDKEFEESVIQRIIIKILLSKLISWQNRVGAELVPAGSWREAPKDHIILGLKELPEDTCMFPFFIRYRADVNRSFTSPSGTRTRAICPCLQAADRLPRHSITIQECSLRS